MRRDWTSVRRTIEYVFVRDEPSSAAVTLDGLIEDARSNGDVSFRRSPQRTKADRC